MTNQSKAEGRYWRGAVDVNMFWLWSCWNSGSLGPGWVNLLVSKWVGFCIKGLIFCFPSRDDDLIFPLDFSKEKWRSISRQVRATSITKLLGSFLDSSLEVFCFLFCFFKGWALNDTAQRNKVCCRSVKSLKTERRGMSDKFGLGEEEKSWELHLIINKETPEAQRDKGLQQRRRSDQRNKSHILGVRTAVPVCASSKPTR